MVSATECAPSASMAAEWPVSPAPSLATAMTKFAAMAAYTVFLLSLDVGGIGSTPQRAAGPRPDEDPGPAGSAGPAGLAPSAGPAGPAPSSGPCRSTRPASAPPT